jgi:hypothetical protein
MIFPVKELDSSFSVGSASTLGIFKLLFPIGKLANFYSFLVSKYGSLCKAVSSQESLDLLSQE